MEEDKYISLPRGFYRLRAFSFSCLFIPFDVHGAFGKPFNMQLPLSFEYGNGTVGAET